ncbi:protein unc-13 homolog [Phragmites australis]|uniref:protein unc-13 homolog n=1 Tax=Phragmites australis TaxID=29695 RepID=UPI002D772235|nr:protein unc-13 homolog [Phragmites australis]
MGHRHLSASSMLEAAGAIPDPFPSELRWPFGHLDSLNRDEFRESAYEIFFVACRSTPAGMRLSATATPGPAGAGDHHQLGGRGRVGAATPTRPEAGAGGAKNMAVTSRLKRALGLRARKTRPMVGAGKAGGRPMTSAEIMRRQMGVTEQSDSRIRKTLVRSLVGPQMSKKVESLVLPMELLRHLKPSDFSDANEHCAWQLRQLKVLKAGLVSHPSVPLDHGNPAAPTLREMIRSAEQQTRLLDVRALSAAVMALSWRSVDVCRWADGYPLNVHLYLSLLRAVFDARDETAVLDEVDELLKLIKKTWNVLGLNKMIHNVCFTWLLFEKYVVTGQIEPDLLSATLAMLEQIRGDAEKQADLLEPGYLRILAVTLASMHSWAEDKLLDYHEAFGAQDSMGAMDNVVSLAVSAAAMLSQDVPSPFVAAAAGAVVDNVVDTGATGGHLPAGSSSSFSAGEQVERYIKSSVRHAFTKLHETGTAGKMDSMIVEVDEDPCETLMYVAAQTKDMARVEKEVYSRVLRQWHPCPIAVAAATLHDCFGALLKRYVSRMACSLSSESVRVLHAASKLDKSLLQMAAEDDPAYSIRQQIMTPYDVDSTIFGLVKGWMDERLTIGAECVRRARDSESWNPRSKAEPYAQSAVDLMKLAKVTVDELLEIQVAGQPPACRQELLQHLVDGIDQLVHQYALLVASCGSKESFFPPLPPLTRCNQDSKLVQLWKKAAPPCQVGIDNQLAALNCGGVDIVTSSKPRLVVSRSRGDQAVRPATSRGTQRLYVRLNTLHYLLTVLHSIDRALSSAPAPQRRRRARSSAFDHARPALDAAVLHVSELSAYRLVFLDSADVLHQALYQGSVSEARIRPALRVMKQNLTFLASVLSERAQPPAVREVMKASVEAFLTVVLAGGSGRAFSRADYGAVEEDFASLKRLFCSFGVAEEVAEREAAQAEGVMALMALSTEKVIDEFLSRCASTSMAPDELSQPPMAVPLTTRRWSRSDANTILRVLCHRDDEAASRFLKKAFDLTKRR